MNILLTGASGFVGTYIRSQLAAAGHTVLSVSRNMSGEGWIQADLSKFSDLVSLFEMYAPDAVIHSAWQGLPDYSAEQCIKNKTMSERLIDVAFSHATTVIGMGSCWEYASRQGAQAETSATSGTSHFAAAKLAVMEHGMQAASRTGKRFYWLRPFFIYGPGQRPDSIIPYIVRTALSGGDLHIKTPHARNDFIHVSDVASALCALLDSKAPGGTYNVGSGQATSVSEIARIVYSVLGMPAPELAEPEMLAQTDNFWADIRKIASIWKPGIPLHEGISDTVYTLT